MKQHLSRITCDQCGHEIIAEEMPPGWLRLLSAGTGNVPGIQHRSNPPLVWTPSVSLSITEGSRASRDNPADFCSKKCLLDFVADKVDKVLDMAARR